MNKIYKIVFVVISLFLLLTASVNAATTSEKMENLRKKEAFFQVYGNQQTAPVHKTDAGEETIKTNYGSLNYSSTDLTLKGKNGLDINFTRHYESSTAEHNAYDTNNDKETKVTEELENLVEIRGSAFLVKYIRENSQEVYIMFDSVVELKETEFEPGKLKVRDLSECDTLWTASQGTTVNKYKTNYYPSDNIVRKFYRAKELRGNIEILTRDLTKSPIWLTTKTTAYERYKTGATYNTINLGSGWSINIPSLIENSNECDEIDEELCYKYYEYDFYDPDTNMMLNYSVKVKIENDRIVYSLHEIEYINSEGYYNTSEMYKPLNEIIPDSGEGEFCIERYDGVRYYFDSYGKLLRKKDKYNNEIAYMFNGNFSFSEINSITDSYGREIVIDRSVTNQTKIMVDGVEMLKYTTEYINDYSIDPENILKEDDRAVFTVYKNTADDDSKILKYNMSCVPNVFYFDGRAYGARAKYFSYTIDSIELSTGGKIFYEYERAISNRDTIYNTDKDIIMVTKKSEKLSDASDEINVITYDCGYDIDYQTIYFYGYYTDENKSTSDTYLSKTGLLEKSSTYYNPENYEINVYSYNTVIECGPIIAGIITTRNLNNNEITTQKETGYNVFGQPTSQSQTWNSKTSQVLTTYNSMGVIEEQKQLQEDNVYIGYKNTISEDGKTILKTQYFKQSGQEYEFFEEIDYEYNECGDIIKTTSHNGDDTVITNISYNYNPEEENILLIKETTVNDVSNIDGKTSLTTVEKYDNYLNLVYQKSPDGNVTEYTYDLLGRLTSQKRPDGSITTVSYDMINNEIITTDFEGGKQKIKYDPLGKEIATYIYNNGFKKVKEIEYDSWDRPIKISLFANGGNLPSSHIEYEYNDDNTVKSEIVKEGEKTLSKKEYEYKNNYFTQLLETTCYVYKSDSDKTEIKQFSDGFGNAVSQSVKNNDETYTMNVVYDLLGNVISSDDFRANDENYENKTVLKNTYDHQNRLIKQEILKDDGTYMENSNEYDLFGNLIKTTDFNGNETEFKYNKIGLKTEVITPIEDNLTSKTKFYYNGNGQVTKTYVQNNKPNEEESYSLTENIYDNTGNLIYVVANDGNVDNVTKYEYNKLGNVTKMVLGLTDITEEVNPEIHQVTSYSYNNLNQLVRVTNPEGITESYIYDYLNQNLSKTNGTVTTDYEYDGLGRVLSISASGNSKDEEILYTYDLMGNITSMTDSSGITEYFYDSLGQLTREIKGEDIKEYSYDANGNRKNFKLNSDIDLSYTYDKLNRIVSVNDGTDTTTYTYDNNGNILNQTGKVSVDNSYNKAGFLTSKVNKSNGNILNQYDLNYYLNGNISDISEPNKTTSYTYDNIGRLTKELVLNESETDYSYDNFSNRSLKTLKDAEGNILSQSSYTYTKNNQLISEFTDNVIKTNYYDNNGNLICKTKNTLVDQADTGDRITISNVKGNDVESYSYDALNRMIKYENGNKTASYTYNGNGLRQSKTVNGIETKHVYDGQNIVKDGENTFVRGIGIISANLNGTKTYYSFNTHNDTEKLLNAQGVVLKDYTYDAFGNEQTPNDEDTNPFRYCGEYFDNETGFIYLRARYYDSDIGRFTTEDPIKDGLNWYVYCENNPIMFVDPSGTELKISGTEEEKETVRKELETIAGTDVYVNEDGIVSLGENNGKMPKGYELVNRIVNSDKTCTIVGGEKNEHARDNGNSIVYFKKDNSKKVMTKNKDTGFVSMKSRPSYIGLAHELIHSDRYFRGTRIDSGVTSHNYKVQPKQRKFLWWSWSTKEDVTEYRVPKEEMATVGFGYVESGDITENDIRKEHDLELRGAYYSVE